MKTSDSLLVLLGFATLAVIVYSVFGKGGATTQSYEAGKWLAQNVWRPIQTALATNPLTVSQTASRGGLESGGAYYLDASYVPPTPAGFSPSNWTWQLPNGIAMGLPAGMTPKEFCAASPTAPICQKGMGVN